MNLLYCVDYHVLGIFLCSLRSIVLHGGYEHYDVYVLHSCFDEKWRQPSTMISRAL